MDTRITASEHLPDLPTIIERLRATDPDSWWAGPTFRSPDQSRHCVLSHVYEWYGSHGFEDFEARFSTSFHIGAQVNDRPSGRYPQAHPKDRVIAYLEAMVAGFEPTTPEQMEADWRELSAVAGVSSHP